MLSKHGEYGDGDEVIHDCVDVAAIFFFMVRLTIVNNVLIITVFMATSNVLKIAANVLVIVQSLTLCVGEFGRGRWVSTASTWRLMCSTWQLL